MAQVPSSQPTPVSHFPFEPDELNLKCLGYLDLRSLLKVSEVCKRLKSLSRDETLWKPLARRLDINLNFRLCVLAYRSLAQNLFTHLNQVLNDYAWRPQSTIDSDLLDKLHLKGTRSRMKCRFPKIERVANQNIEKLLEEKCKVLNRGLILQDCMRISIFIAELHQDELLLPNSEKVRELMQSVPVAFIRHRPTILGELKTAHSRLRSGTTSHKIKIPVVTVS